MLVNQKSNNVAYPFWYINDKMIQFIEGFLCINAKKQWEYQGIQKMNNIN